jgi:vitamin B12 transporter
VRSLGGLGQFSSLSLRGSSAQQVAVFLDGVPIGGSGGVVNLGDLPLDSLGRLTVHRGLVPVVYGGAAIGGAVDLASALRCDASRRRFGATLGVGSFAANEARATASIPLAPRRRGPCLDLRIGHAGATGDFRFYNLGETLQDPRDDRSDRRQNNAYDRLLTQLAIHGARGPWRYSVQELLLVKHQGIPGLATGQQARATTLDTLSARTVARVRRDFDDGGRPGHIDLAAGFAATRSTWRDPLGEVGLGIDDQRTQNLDLYLSPRLHLDLWRGASLLAMADGRQEWSRVDQRLLPAPQGDSQRQRVNLGLGLQLDQHLLGAASTSSRSSASTSSAAASPSPPAAASRTTRAPTTSTSAPAHASPPASSSSPASPCASAAAATSVPPACSSCSATAATSSATRACDPSAAARSTAASSLISPALAPASTPTPPASSPGATD